MKILAHLHTFNDNDVIDLSLQAILNQTHPVDEILIVDNASTDQTLQRSFPDKVTIIRNKENLGTSGAVVAGMKYALEKNFDWIWVFDADSAPHEDALEHLVDLFRNFDEETKEKVWLLCCLPMEVPDDAVTSPFSLGLINYSGIKGQKPRHAVTFTDKGYERVKPDPDQTFYPCDGQIWSGCLYKMEAVRQVGLPSEDLVLDWAEYEYGYRGKRKGFQGITHQFSFYEHNIRRQASFQFTHYHWGIINFKMIEMPPIRCYYVLRNTLYFWLHEYHIRSFYTLAPRIFKALILITNFLLRPFSRTKELIACLRGTWDGVFKRLHCRY